jgi:hypothetical protein
MAGGQLMLVKPGHISFCMLQDKDPTIAELLKPYGYATAQTKGTRNFPCPRRKSVWTGKFCDRVTKNIGYRQSLQCRFCICKSPTVM